MNCISTNYLCYGSTHVLKWYTIFHNVVPAVTAGSTTITNSIASTIRITSTSSTASTTGTSGTSSNSSTSSTTSTNSTVCTYVGVKVVLLILECSYCMC